MRDGATIIDFARMFLEALSAIPKSGNAVAVNP
jgi:hypothetical protein